VLKVSEVPLFDTGRNNGETGSEKGRCSSNGYSVSRNYQFFDVRIVEPG
jgi:hypothetical protein